MDHNSCFIFNNIFHDGDVERRGQTEQLASLLLNQYYPIIILRWYLSIKKCFNKQQITGNRHRQNWNNFLQQKF